MRSNSSFSMITGVEKSWSPARNKSSLPSRRQRGLADEALELVGAVALAVTGTYPRPLYDLVLGLNRCGKVDSGP